MKLHPLSVLLVSSLAFLASCAGEYAPNRATSAAGAAPVAVASVASAPAGLAEKLTELVGVAPEQIVTSKANGLLEAKWGSNFAYITADGQYVIFGDMINVNTQEEVTEGQRRGARLSALEQLGAENTIEYAGAETKYTVTVFTDVDCGYCRVMHRQMKDYNDRGITIRYVFFPRSGPRTESFAKAERVWCAKDRHAALTEAKNSGDFAGPSNCENPVMRDWQLAQQFGLRGTPVIMMPNGDAMPGYLPPDQLQAKLESLAKGHSASPDSAAKGG